MSILMPLGSGFASALLAVAPIVNPLGCAVLFAHGTADRTRAERARLAGRIALNAALVLVIAMWAGATLMSMFGVGVAALRIAGGLVVALHAWRMLDGESDGPGDPPGGGRSWRDGFSERGAFVPLTVPFTTGPGTLATAVALGAARPVAWAERLAYSTGMAVAALAIAACVWIAYVLADRLLAIIGPAATILVRLSALVLLCIGVEILLHGLRDALA